MKDDIIIFLLSTEGIKITSIYFFQIIILLAFFKILFFRCDDKKDLKKIVGGLTVFVIAIIANSTCVYILSLFIGGLIIASEEFLKFIFAVWKGNPDKIDKIVRSFSRATDKEIEEKRDKELKIILENEKLKDKELSAIKSKYLIAENQVHEYFRKKYKNFYQQEVKIQNKCGSMVFDGAIMSKVESSDIFSKEELKGRNDLGVMSAVEIKFFQDHFLIKPVIQRLLEQLSFYDFVLIFQIVIVVENLDKKEAEKIYSDLLEKYSEKPKFHFYIFALKNDKVELLKS